MNPAREILQYGKQYSATYSSQPFGYTRPRCAVQFIREQANASFYDLVTACQTKLNLPTEYFSAIQKQIISTQRAWDAITAEKERYDTVGWQMGTAEFTRALHTCLYMIPERTDIGLLGHFHGIQALGPCSETGLADLSSTKSNPVTNDNAHDLPDYEESVSPDAFVTAPGSVQEGALRWNEGEDWEGQSEEDSEEDDTNQKGGRERFVYPLDSKGPEESAWEELPVVDPWRAFLGEREQVQESPGVLPKRKFSENEGDETGEGSKRRRMML